MAEAIASGWVVVLEFDDHPRLIAELTGDPGAPPDWGRFAYQHAIQVSTPALKTFFQAYNPQVAVFPNAVFDLQPFPRGRDRPRVFFGGALRGPFVAEVARSLGPAIAAHPRTEFTVVGDRAFFEALPTGHKEFHDYLPYEGYLALMRRCAISLSPLEDRPLIETKSDAKFLDAASVGALTIASPPVYAATVVDGVNGLIARELDDWPRLLARALADPAWREGMARAAWDYVRAERMFAQQVPARKAWYRDLWARRDALNRALYARLPGLEAAVQAKGA
jgi:glycosyltransferase involved in cell wall biosynthesis